MSNITNARPTIQQLNITGMMLSIAVEQCQTSIYETLFIVLYLHYRAVANDNSNDRSYDIASFWALNIMRIHPKNQDIRIVKVNIRRDESELQRTKA